MRQFIAGFIVLLMSGALNAAVAFDAAVNSGDLSLTTSGSWSHTVTGTDTYIVLGLGGWDASDTIGAATGSYAGEALTELGGRQTAGSNNSILWGASGANTGSNTMAYANVPVAYAELGGGSVSFTGVHQTVSVGTLVSDSSETDAPSVVITANTGDMGVDILYSGAYGGGLLAEEEDPVAGASETGRVNSEWVVASVNQKNAVMGTEPGAGSTTMNWTDGDGYDVSYSAIPLLQSGAAAPTPKKKLMWMRQ